MKAISKIGEELVAWMAVGIFLFATIKLLESIF